MTLSPLRTAIVTAALLTGAIGATADAQVRRVQTPPPTLPPGYQPPSIDPLVQKLNALQTQVNALRESAGRQLIVLNFTQHPTMTWSDADNSFPNNNARAETICKEALGDRYGRVVSRKPEPDMSVNRWFFPNVVCETKP